MPRMDTLGSGTLLDSSRVPAEPETSRLIFVGTPEDGFANAGRVFELAGLRCVEFRRAKREPLRATIEDGVLRIGLPHPWVSGHHADLELDDAITLIDRDSRNGTLVEGDMVERATLASGDIFEVGRCFWMVRQTKAPMVDPAATSLVPAAYPALAASMHALSRLAPTRVPILLIGDTGTGKSHLAREVHRATGRSGPFVALNMMARSVESDLLGDGDNLIASARGGTLFLDDVGGLSMPEQSRLLSGLLAHAPADTDALDLAPDGVRVVAAASTNLHRRASEATFRPELYARLAGYECRIPPLCERREDLGLLIHRLLNTAGAPELRIKVDVFRSMLSHGWAFNVRELSDCLSAAVALCDEGSPITAAVWREVQWPASNGLGPSRLASVRETIIRELAAHRGNKEAVAQSLGCDLDDIDRWLGRFDLEPESFAS